MVKQVLARHGIFKNNISSAELPEKTLSSENLLNMAFKKLFFDYLHESA
jgi:hypothetical protein